ncbi:hypothetical protein H5410_040409 [Solanum commersonii]|uniref:Gag-pol polyprotein n=1 Tax=Solanum commersonii TaxID=4109 RepID=A0A9J5XQU2_SOLCO|nr:hypothetical protein H5410_040409 [Solanum commersonii]
MKSSSVAPPERDAPRGATFGTGGGGNRLYAITSRQEQEDLPYVVTGMIQVFNYNVYALLDPGASLSFVTLYVAMYFNVIPEQLSEPFSVSTHSAISLEIAFCSSMLRPKEESQVRDENEQSVPRRAVP